MNLWRLLIDRLSLVRRVDRGDSRARTKMVLKVVPFLFLFLLAGCGRGSRHESWPGLRVQGETIYASNLNAVQALEAETGKVYWSFPTNEGREAPVFYAAPVLAEEYGDNGLLLVAGYEDGTVYALALGESPTERPDELWRFTEAGGHYVAPGTVAQGLFIIGNGDNNVYALDLEDGSLVWRFTTEGRVWAQPLVVDDTVYVASLDHGLYALDLASGEEQWQIELAGSSAMRPIYADGHLWIGDFASTLYQIDPETQDVVWTFEAQDWLWATPLLHDGILYFADVGGQVYALDIATRTFVWNSPAVVDDIVHGQPALSEAEDLLFVAGYETGRVFVIETADGSVRENWTETLENPGRLPGDLVTDGVRLYTMPILVQERVQAYDLTTGELVWSTPDPE